MIYFEVISYSILMGRAGPTVNYFLGFGKKSEKGIISFLSNLLKFILIPAFFQYKL